MAKSYDYRNAKSLKAGGRLRKTDEMEHTALFCLVDLPYQGPWCPNDYGV